jgi:hypothetical protein
MNQSDSNWGDMPDAPKDRPILVAWGTNASGAMGWDVVKFLRDDKWESEINSDRYTTDTPIRLIGWVNLPSLPPKLH